jgi:hypothetical protein
MIVLATRQSLQLRLTKGYAPCTAIETVLAIVVHRAGMFLCKDRADLVASARPISVLELRSRAGISPEPAGGWAMRLMIEIAAAALLMVCISAAFAAGKAAKSADGLGCSFSVAKNASPAARCAAIKRQCGGKFHANYCGDKLLSAM